jgi:hypothetical protein
MGISRVGVVVGILIAFCSAAEAADVLFEWSGVLPLEGFQTFTNPNVSPGESWEFSYVFDDTTPLDENHLWRDSSLTATITFSGGYSAPLSIDPGIVIRTLFGTFAPFSTGAPDDSFNFDLYVMVPLVNDQDPLQIGVFPPDGTYVPELDRFLLFSVFEFANSDGVINNHSEGNFVSVTVTTLPDFDGDGVADHLDNCSEAANPAQDDTDGDFCGNLCDANYDGHGRVGHSDFGAFTGNFGTTNELYQHLEPIGGGEHVGFGDWGFFTAHFGTVPGPSGTTPGTTGCPL